MLQLFVALSLFFAGCATPPGGLKEDVQRPTVPLLSHKPRQLILFVPQTDDAAGSWLKWFVRYPRLRMVIAMSPRFQRFAKDPILKSQILALQKEGRLELALQLPNAPLLPLLMEPPYDYPDDVIQLIAHAKAGFFRHWNLLPRGLVLPHGAASPQLVSLLERLGFAWVAGALGAPAVDGPYQSGPLKVWDGAASDESRGTVVRVWDERQMTGASLIPVWAQDLEKKNMEAVLPSDPGLEAVPMPTDRPWGGRSWTQADWSLWIGSPAKNAAWSLLRKAREALEAYKNSGQASVQRLDMAFQEIYTAQNSNYFAAFGNINLPAGQAGLSPATAEEREHEFQATLAGIFRLIGQAPPADLFKPSAAVSGTPVKTSSTTVRAEVLPNGGERVVLEDAAGDSPLDLKSMEVWTSNDTASWTVTLSSTSGARVDIYVDINNQPNVGTPSLLPGRGLVASPADAWEYAITLSGGSATLYRTQGAGTYGVVGTFPLTVMATTMQLRVPREVLRGSPRRWGYQVLVLGGEAGPVYDWLDPVTSGEQGAVPFVRVRSVKP